MEAVTAVTRVRQRANPNQGSEERPAGEALLAEATELVFRRKWTASIKVLEAAKRLRPNDLAVDELLAVAAARAGKKRLREEAVQRLSNANADATNWTAIAAARLADRNYTEADGHARKAIEFDSNSIGAWNAMAASYAGLGWFDEATECLERAEKADQALHDKPSGLNPLEHWQLGQAINTWAMTSSHLLIVAVVSVLLLGLLGAAIAITAPLLLREYRVSRLDVELREVADEVWRHDHRPRLIRGFGVLAVAGCWLAVVVTTG